MKHVMDPTLVYGGQDDEFDDNKDLAIIHVHGGLDEEVALVVWDKWAVPTNQCDACLIS